jgi:DNA-binding winged helix-turn-helix (wHTH) protein
MRDAVGFVPASPLREASPLVRFAALALNLDACVLAHQSGQVIPLTRGELALLRMFVTRPGRVISRDTLLDAFTNRRFQPFDRSIDVLVGRLRRKIEPDPKQPRLVVTVPGEGYRFDGLTQPLLSEQKPLNGRRVAAEARRAAQAPTPDSMDLYFQGSTWLNKGLTPGCVAQARSVFDRALATDPDNVDALIGAARFVIVAEESVAAVEAKLTTALSSAPDHARAHLASGVVHIYTKRAAEGIAECEHALAVDRNLASAHALIGFGKALIGRAEESEAHVGEALRLSPRDTAAYIWMGIAGAAKSYLSDWAQAVVRFRRAIEANRNYPDAYFLLAAATARLGRLDEAHSAVKAGLALNPAYTVSRARDTRTARSDDPTYLGQLEPIFDGMRKAGVPEG